MGAHIWAPEVHFIDGNRYVYFSAGAANDKWRIGMLTANASADLTNPASWTKSAQPVFKSNDATGQYGPGHNSFTVSENGKSDILVADGATPVRLSSYNFPAATSATSTTCSTPSRRAPPSTVRTPPTTRSRERAGIAV
ncbi:hypothetical protein ABT147_01665 [Streptomyces sp. NPDC001868]|uniref:hypothetical protein n=1 Tax=Streptomyces sp. NPDC001868 TaxID=3154401 RepID=UPI0033193F03